MEDSILQNILQTKNHPNIVKYFGNVRVRNSYHRKENYLVFENLQVSLECLVKTWKLSRLKWPLLVKIILFEILMGLLYLHSNDKAHRDLCPNNIMLSNAGLVKLIDFGQCWEFNNPNKGDTTVGTSGYQSPEVLDRRKYDHKVDVFAFGLIAYETFYGKQFCGSDLSPSKTIEKLGNRIHEFELEQVSSYSEKMFRALLKKCLVFRSDRRFEVRELMEDQYFMEVHDLCRSKKLLTVCRERLNNLIKS